MAPGTGMLEVTESGALQLERPTHIEEGTDMDELHVVVGAGPIGSGIVREQAERGHRVKIVTRSGSGPELAGSSGSRRTHQTPARWRAVATGAAAIYNCANPPYHRWPELWPPMAAAMLSAAERSGAVLVTISNLYGYGPAQGTGGYTPRVR